MRYPRPALPASARVTPGREAVRSRVFPRRQELTTEVALPLQRGALRERWSQSESPLSESTFLLNFVLESCNWDSLVIPC